MTPEQITAGWRPRRVGRRVLVLSETTSTNTAAFDAVAAGLAAESPDQAGVDGLVVLAEYQTAGRGRQGRTWSSPRGASVLCSVVLLLPDSPDDISLDNPCAVSHLLGTAHARIAGWLTLVSAVAACEAIRRATDVSPAIKWPNDLRVGGRKLGGILIESRGVTGDSVGVTGRRAWVIGTGINCLQQAGHFPPELRQTSTSLEMASAQPIDRVAVARELVRALDKWLADNARLGDQAVLEAWLTHAEPIGQRVRLRHQGLEYSGHTVEVDPWGGLIVQGDDGRREWFDPMLTTLL